MPSIVGYAVKVTSPAHENMLGVVISAIDGFAWQVQKCTVRIRGVGDVDLKRGVKSPNLADAFICARVPGVTSLEISDGLLKSLGG